MVKTSWSIVALLTSILGFLFALCANTLMQREKRHYTLPADVAPSVFPLAVLGRLALPSAITAVLMLGLIPEPIWIADPLENLLMLTAFLLGVITSWMLFALSHVSAAAMPNARRGRVIGLFSAGAALFLVSYIYYSTGHVYALGTLSLGAVMASLICRFPSGAKGAYVLFPAFSCALTAAIMLSETNGGADTIFAFASLALLASMLGLLVSSLAKRPQNTTPAIAAAVFYLIFAGLVTYSSGFSPNLYFCTALGLVAALIAAFTPRESASTKTHFAAAIMNTAAILLALSLAYFISSTENEYSGIFGVSAAVLGYIPLCASLPQKHENSASGAYSESFSAAASLALFSALLYIIADTSGVSPLEYMLSPVALAALPVCALIPLVQRRTISSVRSLPETKAQAKRAANIYLLFVAFFALLSFAGGVHLLLSHAFAAAISVSLLAHSAALSHEPTSKGFVLSQFSLLTALLAVLSAMIFMRYSVPTLLMP